APVRFARIDLDAAVDEKGRGAERVPACRMVQGTGVPGIPDVGRYASGEEQRDDVRPIAFGGLEDRARRAKILRVRRDGRFDRRTIELETTEDECVFAAQSRR